MKGLKGKIQVFEDMDSPCAKDFVTWNIELGRHDVYLAPYVSFVTAKSALASARRYARKFGISITSLEGME